MWAQSMNTQSTEQRGENDPHTGKDAKPGPQ